MGLQTVLFKVHLTVLTKDLFTEKRNYRSLQQFITALTIRVLQSWEE